jgi:membrane-associated phospholipid phosphatase
MSAALSTFAGLIVIAAAGLVRQDRAHRRQDLLTAIGFALYIAAGIKLHLAIVHWFPKTLDPQFLHYDQTLGFQPLHVMALARQHPAVLAFLEASYWLLSGMLGLAWVVEQNRVLRLAAFLGGVFCFAFYMLLPAVGPVFYNWNAGIALNAPRNCMPSMHLTWAMLMAWNARRLPWRLLFGIYSLIMAAATLAIGQHYLIDLLAAVPYAILIQISAASLLHPKKVQAPPLSLGAAETSMRND